MNISTRQTMPHYAELQAISNFSFLRGGSHPEELVETAKELGLKALGLADYNSLAGVVRGHVAAKKAGQRLIIGSRLHPTDGPALITYPIDRAAYGQLSRLLSLGKMRAEKGDCHFSFNDILDHGTGQIFVSLPPQIPDTGFQKTLEGLSSAFPGNVYLAASHLYRGNDRARIGKLKALGDACNTPLLATNDILYHAPSRRPLQDVLTCIGEKCRIDEAGFRLARNAERHLKDPKEILRLFKGFEDAVERTAELPDRCSFNLDELAYEYPDEPVPDGMTPQDQLEHLTWAGARERYPDGIPAKVESTLSRELKLIDKLNFAPYFLTVHDIVRYARSQDILCQGRGSAANSAVCYCLGVTAVDPTEIDLLFDRFVSEARGEPPDIDVDFEHERREEVIQYIYQRYGRRRASIAATCICYRPRSAIREVGKVMGLSEDVTSALAGTVWGSHGSDVHVRETGLDPTDPRLAQTIALASELLGFPRHLSQHVGGFILTKGPLSETVPIGNGAMEDRTFIEWDKDDIDALGILKVDVLGLGMLTCIRKCFHLIRDHCERDLSLATLPRDDPAVYDMLCRADAIGVFQVESRAQLNMLPRLKPRKFYDLVIEVAIVRPGPIQGDMVHPYLRRRDGIEDVDYPSPSPEHGDKDELKRVLDKTKGVPLFQEQAMRIAIEAAKFSPDEANELRHAMATFRRRGTIEQLQDKMVSRMINRGYDPDFARRCFDQIKGFGEYGFPESHAASFAHLVYVSAWIKCHYPAAFACGLLNSQPMGFYAPAQIVRDAQEHGVDVRPVDVNHSVWNNCLEECEDGTLAVRLGFRQVDGLLEDVALGIEAARPGGPFLDIADLRKRARLTPAMVSKLAAADCFRSLQLDRRQALWQVSALRGSETLPLFDHAAVADSGPEPFVQLPETPLSEHVIADYQTLRLSLKAHPISFLRNHYAQSGLISARAVQDKPHGAWVRVAGIVLVRQRPGSAKGVVFITLEDETGIVNSVVWPKVMERQRKVVMGARLIQIGGFIQRHEAIIHLVARRLTDLTGDLKLLSDGALRPPLARADEVARPVPEGRDMARHPRQVRAIPKSRDFH